MAPSPVQAVVALAYTVLTKGIRNHPLGGIHLRIPTLKLPREHLRTLTINRALSAAGAAVSSFIVASVV